MKQLTFLEKIFSITNQGYYKVISLFGFKVKISSRMVFKLLYSKLPIQKNKIVFDNFGGGSYGCNPKYIAQEIIKRKLPYELVWLVNNKRIKVLMEEFPSQIRLVNFKSRKALKELATAKLWIENQRKVHQINKGLMKKENQYYLQTWHGSLGIKKLDADVKAFTDELNKHWVEAAKIDSSMWDFLLTNSKFENNIFKKAFWYNNVLKQFGHPRNDIFFKDCTDIKNKIYKIYDVKNDTKVLLYVPSFRDDGRLWAYNLEYIELQNTLKTKFGGNWIIMIRLHPRFKKYQDLLVPYTIPNIINATEYPDIQELLATADIVITDYSSCIFDFMLTKRPAFIYANDINEYDKDRGFYYPLTSTPFPVAQNNEDLKNNILNFDYEIYKQKVEEFLKEKGCMEDGHASERVVDLIEQIMDNESNNSN